MQLLLHLAGTLAHLPRTRQRTSDFQFEFVRWDGLDQDVCHVCRGRVRYGRPFVAGDHDDGHTTGSTVHHVFDHLEPVAAPRQPQIGNDDIRLKFIERSATFVARLRGRHPITRTLQVRLEKRNCIAIVFND